MGRDNGLIGALLSRLGERLPHRTGSSSHDLRHDELVLLTRTTLIQVSYSDIAGVVGPLVAVIDDLARPHDTKCISQHPTYILHSELFLLELLADCFWAHWSRLNGGPEQIPKETLDTGSARSSVNFSANVSLSTFNRQEQISAPLARRNATNRDKAPAALADVLVEKVLRMVKRFLVPFPEGQVLSAYHILDNDSELFSALGGGINPGSSNSDSSRPAFTDTANLIREKTPLIGLHTKGIIEFLSASNWSYVLEMLKTTLRSLHTQQASSSGRQTPTLSSDERNALATIRMIASLYVDGKKLSLLLQELCGCFLYLSKPFQNAVALALPLLITRWLEQNPREFVELHSRHRRIDGGVETLFEMSNSMSEGRRKALLFPFQTALLLLLPDVFEVASHMRDARGSSLAKKVVFLEGLRKAAKNRNETAAYCLVSVLRVARHFPLDSDSALLSYALDVQDEIEGAVFAKQMPGVENTITDASLMTAAFVSIAYLHFDSCVNSLTPMCLSSSSPTNFKVAVISACAHFAWQPDASRFEPLFEKVAEFIRVQLKALSIQTRTDEPSSLRPLRSPASLHLVYSILTFLNISPLTMFIGAPTDVIQYRQFFEDNFMSLVPCMAADDEQICMLTSSVAQKVMVDVTTYHMQNQARISSLEFVQSFWDSTSQVLVTVSRNALTLGPHAKSALLFIHDYLESRLKLLRSLKPLTSLPDAVAGEYSLAAERLETVFLAALCSPELETCQLITACIGFCCEEGQIIGVETELGKAIVAIFKNLESYLALSSRDFRFTGLVAFQKRFRGILRGMKHPTAGMLSAWETAFDAWYEHSEQLLANNFGDAIPERSFVEWRNYSGLLASLGGTCVSDQPSALDEVGLAGLRWIDRFSQERQDKTLLEHYLTESMQLLACDNIRAREATREVLSSEISPHLYLALLRTLETELDNIFNDTRVALSQSPESRLVFAEQAAALLKTVIESLGMPVEMSTALSIDIGTLSLSFARYLDNIPESITLLKVKIRVCQLCETVTRKKDLLNLTHDVRIRNQLLEVMFGWITRPGSSQASETLLSSTPRSEDATRLQKDLDKACLKALADLTYRLPLQPPDGQSDADTSDSKSQMFDKYFNRFLSLLNFEKSHDSTKNGTHSLTNKVVDSFCGDDLAITALSNLLSANIDIGLKHSLQFGYDNDVEIRTAFVKVLCNVLVQGTEFNTLSDASINDKYEKLLELIVNDTALTIALCDACPSTEVDEMTISLLNIFDSRGLAFVLLQRLIEHEIEETENEAELLRRNCVATKMLSVYAKWKGAGYLRSTLQKVLERLLVTSKDLDLELDPARTSSTEELQKNALQLRVVTKVFIDDICNSATEIPVSFRKICHIISSSVMNRFPEAKFTAVGSFIFLRFFCPAIVAPDAEGLISSTPSKEMRRGLLLIAKVVQNLANNVLFGAKEPYMFPLNDFLTQNIYRVTTFLREISAPPTVQENLAEAESFDFGSCVALHRFLYDHWDHVRHNVVAQERKGSILQSPLDNKGKIPILETLRNLITKLGPPPTDVSWNRPMINVNTPPLYSRFQHFMLRNAGRNTESVVSSRAVYDGGESKDGIPMICIILRNIETETTDHDLLLYCYLKIASRMWHRPFGILIDATCYNGQNEPQDALFRKLDLLTPTELSKQLSRVYVYNMNSAFRKCFRRILRISAKSEHSAFHPKNIDYHLIGSLQDLQSHFHLSQLHLPKETISVVTDTRFVFQPVIRLSKTKGKIEVVIKVGSQFVQVTTTKKQEVVPGLRLYATVNDIFRLAEVDEAPTSIQTEDDSAFGLRTENGKIVMYFTSPRKADVIQSIRGAKQKNSSSSKAPRSFERLVRPQDVPGTLLNIALSNISSFDQVLRGASYNLLCALCHAFKFSIDSKFLATKDLRVPVNPAHFIVSVSQQLARSEPQLTSDFLNEFFRSWESFPPQHRSSNLSYVAPWLSNLRDHVLTLDADSEKSRERVAVICRKLITVVIADGTLAPTLNQVIWPVVRQDEMLTDLFLEEIIKIALAPDFDGDEAQLDALGNIVTSLETVTVRGKLLARLRKALNRSSLSQSRHLPDNRVWPEICVLLKLCVATAFDSGVQAHLYLPELFHLVTMLACTGSEDNRYTVHRLLVNTIHAIITSFALEDSKASRLKAIVNTLEDPHSELSFSLQGLPRDGSSSQGPEVGYSSLTSTDNLTNILLEVSIVAAPSMDLANTWRSRWMSLIASTAFQSNPAIQPRAFAVMGCLAREDVDDDLLYQVLVALRNSIERFVDDNDSEMLIAIVTALTKMMEKLPTASRYGLQLFWLAMSLVRLVPVDLFNCAALFLEAVLGNISTSGEFQGGRMVPVLLQGRLPLEDAASELDIIYGVHFTQENFHFAVCASLAKGLSETTTKPTALRVLSTFLETYSSNMPAGYRYPEDSTCLPYLGLLISRALSAEEAKEALWLAGVVSSGSDTPETVFDMIDILSIQDRELLLNVALSVMDFTQQDSVVQNRVLVWLNRVAIDHPTILLHLSVPSKNFPSAPLNASIAAHDEDHIGYAPLASIIQETIIDCQNSVTLESGHVFLRTLYANPDFAAANDQASGLEDVLETIGFGGLWRGSRFHHSTSERDRQCTLLTDRLIELIIA